MDFYLFSQINQLVGKHFWLDVLAIFFAQYFEFVLIFFLILFLLKNFKKYSQMVMEAFFSSLLAKEIFVDIIRQLFPRTRPFVENQFKFLINDTFTSAFPSAHAAFYFAVATSVYIHNKKAGTLFLLSAFLISVSRVFVGVHWPSDIVIGALIGVLAAFIINKAIKEFPR